MKWGRGRRRTPPRPALQRAPVLHEMAEGTIARLLEAPTDDNGFVKVHRDRLVELLHDLQREIER